MEASVNQISRRFAHGLTRLRTETFCAPLPSWAVYGITGNYPYGWAALHPLTLRRCRTLASRIDRSKPRSRLDGPRNELFNYSSHLEAGDLQDHIYGILGIMRVNIKPDYHLPVSDVYCKWARWLADVGSDSPFRSLDRAGIGHKENSKYDLPSWVPDWSSTPEYRYSRTSSICAHEGLCSNVSIAPESALILDGIIVGTVAPQRKHEVK